MFNSFEKKSSAEILRKKHVEKAKKSYDPEMTRRDFLRGAKTLVKTGAILSIGAGIGETARYIADKYEEKNKSGKVNNENKNLKPDAVKKELVVDDRDPDEGVVFESDFVNLNEQDKENLKKRLNPSVYKKFEVTPQVVEQITTYWVDEFKKRDQKTGEFKRAKEEMEEKILEVSPYFMGKNFPPAMVYLAIPESSWRPTVISRSGAIGCYQVMPATAETIYRRKGWTKKFDDELERIEKSFKTIYNKEEFRKRFAKEKSRIKHEVRAYVKEDLTDVTKNAEVASEVLDELFAAVKNSPDKEALALAGYNGSFFWEFVKRNRSMNNLISWRKEPQYADFLKFLEVKIEKERRKILKKSSFSYQIKEVKKQNKQGKYETRLETLSEIATRFGIPVIDLIKLNSQIDENKKVIPPAIEKNAKLRIPYSKKSQEKRFDEVINGLLENLQYPAKMWALLDYLKIRPTKKFAEHRGGELPKGNI